MEGMRFERGVRIMQYKLSFVRSSLFICAIADIVTDIVYIAICRVSYGTTGQRTIKQRWYRIVW